MISQVCNQGNSFGKPLDICCNDAVLVVPNVKNVAAIESDLAQRSLNEARISILSTHLNSVLDFSRYESLSISYALNFKNCDIIGGNEISIYALEIVY